MHRLAATATPTRNGTPIDVQRFAQVLWRFKFLVVAGVVAAVVLATLSFAKVGLADNRPVLTYRQGVVWASQETLLLSQTGFPEGRATSTPTSDLNRLSGLSAYYAQLANGDAVRSRIPLLGQGRELPVVTVSPVTSYVGGNASLLPMLTITGEAGTPASAIAVTRSASDAFREYLELRQSKADIPGGQRVVVSVLTQATRATVAEPRKKTVPLMVFVAVLAATLGLVLILENVRPPRPATQPAPVRKIPGQKRKVRARIAGVGRSDVRR